MFKLFGIDENTPDQGTIVRPYPFVIDFNEGVENDSFAIDQGGAIEFFLNFWGESFYLKTELGAFDVERVLAKFEVDELNWMISIGKKDGEDIVATKDTIKGITEEMVDGTDYTREFLDFFDLNILPARVWVYDLIACFQVKTMKSKNIANYLASKGLSVRVSKTACTLLTYYAAKFPQIVNSEEDRTFFDVGENAFMRYHTTACSTGRLCSKFIEEMGDDIKMFYSEDTIEKCHIAAQNSHSLALANAIPRAAVLVMCCYMKAAGTYPDEYKQGERVLEESRSALVKRFTAIFKKYIALTSGTDVVDDAADLTEFRAAMESATVV